MIRIGARRSEILLAAIAAGICAALTFTGCAQPPASVQDRLAPPPPRAEAPRTGPLLTSGTPITVIGTDAETKACFYGVLFSMPPGCEGLVLTGWDWNAYPGQFQELGRSSGLRQGEFILTGYLDEAAGTFAPVSAEGAADSEPADELPLEERLATTCPEPRGGWRVVDEATTTEETMESVTRAAEKLEGYSMLWLDSFTMADPAKKRRSNDPKRTIINVKVTHGIARAEKKLRELWGGMLCISKGTRTYAELLKIQDQVHAKYQHLSSGPQDGEYLWVGTLYDNGSLQREFDRRYGAGAVRVSSQLKVVDPAAD